MRATARRSERTRTVDDLDVWIQELRGRLQRGELSGLGPVDVGYGTDSLRVELVVRIMLNDLDDVDAGAPAGRGSPASDVRRRVLLDDFKRLRDVIG
jgi:hypothetical protein